MNVHYLFKYIIIFFLVSLAVNSKNCHTAGWDAYYAGYIFIKMIHVFATKQFKR